MPSTDLLRFASLAAPKIKPYAAQDRDGNGIHVYDAELIRIIAKYFGGRYEILTSPDDAFGTELPDGNWTGIIGMVRRSESDLAMSGVSVTAERFGAVNFSFPHLHSTLTFMTDAPVPLAKNSAIFYPFSSALWTALAGLTLAMSLVFHFLLNGRQPYQKVLLSTVRGALENAVDLKTRRTSFKMAAFGWILAMFIVASSYRAVLLSFLTFPTMVGIRDIRDLSRAAASGASFKCISFAGSYVNQDFAKSDDPSWRAIGECLIRNESPGNAMENFDAAPRGKAFVGSKLMTVPYERRYFVSKDDFYIELYGIPYSKTFCCPEELNRVLHRFFAAGIFEKISREENFFTILKMPSLTREHSEASDVISLGDMGGSFYILICGWTAGFITFLIEIFMRKYTLKC